MGQARAATTINGMPQRSAPPLRRPTAASRLAGAAPLAAVTLLAASALAACSSGPVTERRNNYDVSGSVTRLVLTGTEGRVRVRTGDGPVTVAETISFTRDEPKTSHRLDGSTLYVDVDGCGKTIKRDRCDASFDIRLPGSTAVEVKLVAGAVDVQDLSGDLKVETTAGAIEASGLRSQHVDVRTQAGKVKLTHQLPPAQTSARTQAGEVTVRLPASGTYAVDATTDAGRKDISVTVDPTSAHRVTALAEAGDITVANA